MPFKDYCELTTTACNHGGPKQYRAIMKKQDMAEGRAQVYPFIPVVFLGGYAFKSLVDCIRRYCKARKENAELAEAIIQEEMQQQTNQRLSANWEV